MSDSSDLYPCTVWSARYAGWYAMPCEYSQVQPGFEGDTEDWWYLLEAIEAAGVPFGKGDSASEAVADLARQVGADPQWFYRDGYGHVIHPGIIYPFTSSGARVVDVSSGDAQRPVSR